MTYTKGTTYKFTKDIIERFYEDEDARFEVSHTNEYGTIFFSEVSDKNREVGVYFGLTKPEQDEDVLVEA